MNFSLVAKHADLLICLSEVIVPGYVEKFSRVEYLPLCWYDRNNTSKRKDFNNRPIDIVFTGTITPYRETVLAELKNKNLNVVSLSPHTPEYIRKTTLDNCKLYLGLKLSINTEVLSKSRAHHVLLNRIPSLFERVDRKTDLDRFVRFNNPRESIVDEVISIFYFGRFADYIPDIDGFMNDESLGLSLNFERLYSMALEGRP